MLAPLIFVGVANDLRTTFVDFDVDATDPSDRARGLLAEHRSCERVEIWREDSCIAVISRVGADQAS
ncbi:hypothetical protein [Caulobacter segnis]